MGKTLSREQRKTSKYTSLDESRKLKKNLQSQSITEEPKPKVKTKWRPRSETDAD